MPEIATKPSKIGQMSGFSRSAFERGPRAPNAEPEPGVRFSQMVNLNLNVAFGSVPRQRPNRPLRRPRRTTYAAAELLLSPTSSEYPHPYLYASNRNIGGTPDPRGDSITIFDPISKPELALVKQVFTGLVETRGMELRIGEVGETYLVAMGAVSGGMVIYKRTDGGKDLVEVARNSSAVPRTSALMRAL
ncbi:hypothetical protein C8R45DRAFT_1165115 [Mycena sanguinolenta]|nr:hypothetical protein C8R45DRAFT_1165115 [Mycena sanguinolenta]